MQWPLFMFRKTWRDVLHNSRLRSMLLRPVIPCSVQRQISVSDVRRGGVLAAKANRCELAGAN